ncbi:MAG: universal stress protein [Thermoplasmatales archaeon]|jgi:nucleotide-binding universal stress UspA family protein|nr:universal stress protein [Thermoplasmatales archaeon]
MSILLAYDGREHTQKALQYAIEYSLAFKTRLYIMTSIVSKDVLDMENELRRVRTFLADAKRRAAEAGCDVETVIEPGRPSEAVVDAAGRYGASAVVVGRSDKTMLDRAVLGSVSEYVVRNAECTVIVVQ